jgi:hypothetical protein
VEQEWPANLAAFVHLRHNGSNVAQADGLPQWFGRQAMPTGTSGDATYLNDWRQVTIPGDTGLGGEWQVVVGAYDPQTGQRLVWQPAEGGDQANTASDEVVLGNVRAAAPLLPDQACALLAGTCASQAYEVR